MTGITNPTEEYFKDGLWGWDGTRWRKLALLWGYSAAYYERLTQAEATAETMMDGSTVPAGEVWVVTSVVAWDNDNIITDITGFTYGDAVWIALGQKQSFTAAQEYWEWRGSIVVPAGGHIRVRFRGCTVGDDLFVDICGYKMRIT